MKPLLIFAVLALVAGCSKNDAPAPAASAPSGPAPTVSPTPSPAAAPADAASAEVPVEEDFEEEASRAVTVQTLDAQLDALEKEITAK